MKYRIYTVTTTFGTFRFAADLIEPTAALYSIPDDAEDPADDRRWVASDYRTADVFQCHQTAAERLLASYGREYWLQPDTVVIDQCPDLDCTTYDGIPQADYVASLIKDVKSKAQPKGQEPWRQSRTTESAR